MGEGAVIDELDCVESVLEECFEFSSLIRDFGRGLADEEGEKAHGFGNLEHIVVGAEVAEVRHAAKEVLAIGSGRSRAMESKRVSGVSIILVEKGGGANSRPCRAGPRSAGCSVVRE